MVTQESHRRLPHKAVRRSLSALGEYADQYQITADTADGMRKAGQAIYLPAYCRLLVYLLDR